MTDDSTYVREFDDPAGNRWEAIAEDTIVAHGKPGAVLAFNSGLRTAPDSLRSTITFNSLAAANFALRTMSVKELRRRLSLARVAAGEAVSA